MALSDDSVAFAAFLNAVAPQIALTSGGQANSLALAILSVVNQVSDQIVDAATNISILTASGDALDALGANYGKTRNFGNASVAAVQFTIPAAVTTVTVIPTATVVQVPALSTSQPSVPFDTLQDAIIPIGSTTSNMVQALAENFGSSGNVVAHTITEMVTSLGAGISVDNPNAVDGATHGGALTVLGTDPQDDATFRDTIQPALQQKYGADQDQSTLNALPGVYDAYVVGSGTLATINIYWAAQDGTQPPATQTAVDLAIRTVFPVSFIPAYPTFTVTQIASISVTYSAPSTTQSAAIEPLIAQAVVDWIQGNTGSSNPTPGLRHAQTIVVLQLATYVQKVLGSALTDFKVTSSIPAAATTTLYRINAGVAAVLLTRA